MADDFDWNAHPIVTPQGGLVQPPPTAPNGFDWNSHPIEDPKLTQLHAAKAQLAPPVNAPGTLQSLGLGAEQGATMDFAPRINAGLIAAYKQLSNAPGADLGQDYSKELENQQDLMDKAKASHPWAYGAGNIAGAVGTTVATGGENLAGEGLAGAAKLGAGYGAITGLGSTKDLTNVGQAAQNAAVGAGIGAFGGVGGSIAGDVVGSLIKPAGQAVSGAVEGASQLGPISRLMSGYNIGKESGLLVGNKAGNEALQQAMDAHGAAQDVFSDALNNATRQAEDLRESAPQINIRDFVNQVKTAATNAKANSKFVDDQQGINRVWGIVKDFVAGVPETDAEGNAVMDAAGNPKMLIQGTGYDVAPNDLIELKRKLGALGSEGDAPLKNQRALAFVNRILSPLDRTSNALERTLGMPEDFTPLKSVINDSIDGLPENQQQIYQMLKVKDDFPSIDDLVNSQKSGTVALQNTKAAGKVQDFYDALPDTLTASIKPSLDQAANKAAQAAQLNTTGISENMLGIGGKGVFGGVGNMAGAAVGGVQRAATGAGQNLASTGTGKLMQSMLNATPQAFSDMGSQLISAPSASLQYVGKALMGAVSKDQVGRNAVIFSLAQNPAYRDAVEKHFGNGDGIENNGPASSASQLMRVNQ